MARDKDIDLNTSGDLPAGSSMHGATSSSMGGLTAAEVKRGYGDGNYLPPNMKDDGSDSMCCLDDDSSKTKGFLSRPEGWER